MGYDESYTQTEHLFGEEPESSLVEHHEGLDRALPILDIGGGQGRNALYLARQGFNVEVLEPSSVALTALEGTARTAGLEVRGHHGEFQTFDAPEGSYGGVLVFGLIQILTWTEIEALRAKLWRWTAPGGLVFVTAFTTEDAGCVERIVDRDVWTPLGGGSFRSHDGDIRTYLTPGKLAEVFDEWSELSYWEGLGQEHRHGDGPLEQHAMVDAVFTR